MGDETPGAGPAGERAAERLLEVLVYAPVGAVLSAVEELPQWRERGRRAVSGQVTTARAVGELAVRFGRRRLDGAVASWTRSSGSSGSAAAPGAATTDRPSPEQASSPSSSSAGSQGVDGETAGAAPEPPDHVPSSSSLAIPGFDTLSASQVVPRLDGLTRADLVAVRAYEAAHRRRRTVLGRVDQLLAERA